MLGVTVLILVISVMTGFDRELRQKVIDFDAHILVTSETTLNNWRELTEKIRATPRVVATAPYVQGPVIVEHDEQRLAPLIRGIDPEQEEKVVSLQHRKIEKVASHLRANGMQPYVAGAGATVAVAIEAGEGFAAATLQLGAEDICGHRKRIMGCSFLSSQCKPTDPVGKLLR